MSFPTWPFTAPQYARSDAPRHTGDRETSEKRRAPKRPHRQKNTLHPHILPWPRARPLRQPLPRSHQAHNDHHRHFVGTPRDRHLGELCWHCGRSLATQMR